MICGRCKERFGPDEDRVCPHCGFHNPPVGSGVIKSSTILISAGDTNAVYRSVKEVPVPLRGKLLKSTNGLNSATILIADRRGREEISRAIRNLSRPLPHRLLRLVLGEEPEQPVPQRIKPSVLKGIGWALAFSSLLWVWLVFTHKWF